MLSNINNFFFKGIYKDAWKKIIPQGLTEAEVDFIQDVANLQNNAAVLDIMCGYGRHSLELARRGFNVTAVDNLEEYIHEINSFAVAENVNIRTIHADLLEMELKSEIYDAVVCMGNSFAFFNRSDAIKILKNVSDHLKRGAVFILNTWTIAEIAIKNFREKEWYSAGEYKCIVENKYNFHPSRINSEETIVPSEGDIEVLRSVDYIFSLNEVELMFQEAGFQTKNLYSTPRKREFSFGDNQIYIVVEKI